MEVLNLERAEKRTTKFMFDTNIFNRILDKKLEVPENCNCEYYVTHIQRDEIMETPEKERREQLLRIFKLVPKEPIPTEVFVLGISCLGSAKLTSAEDGKLYDEMLRKLKELDRKSGKKKRPENQKRDVLILLTCLKNNITLVTEDGNLRKLAYEYNVEALSLEQFQQITRHIEKETRY